ncbi:MAG: hypothetical protein JO168_20305 [Solirubrobacterales bacterium]|nr:hypothetical protein [Solirubrobacterales bacterium]
MMLGRPGALIYGVITVDALLAAESSQRQTYTETVAAVLLALLVYWLAHSYSEYADTRLRRGESLTPRGLLSAMTEEFAIALGAAGPLLALGISWAVGASLTTAVNFAIWTSAVAITVIEVAAAVRAGKTGRDLAAQSMVGALLGLGVIAMRLILH